MKTTRVTLANGRVFTVQGNYEDMRAYLTTGERREVKLETGERMTVPVAWTRDALIEEVAEKRKVGFA